MFCFKLSQVLVSPVVKSSANKAGCFSKFGYNPQVPVVRLYADEGRQTLWKTARRRRRTFAETIAEPAGTTAFNIGKGAVAGGAALGLGALCFYGLGLSSQAGVIENARLWPSYVKERVRDTYLYFGGSVLLTAGSSYAVFRSPTMLNLVSKNSMLAIGASLVAMMGTGMLAQSLPYAPGVNAKSLAWVLHTSVIGAVIAPICMVGGPILVRAAWYTLGVVGGLSTVAACAPSEKFLNMGGPLAIGLGVVFVSSLGGMFLPPTTALGAGLYSISLYGGLLLFSAFLLYDTQRIVKKAETHPLYAPVPYDPINASISIYLDTLNIFLRIVTILAGQGNRKR